MGEEKRDGGGDDAQEEQPSSSPLPPEFEEIPVEVEALPTIEVTDVSGQLRPFIRDLPMPQIRPRRDLEQQRETLRGWIASALLAILAFIVIGSFVSLWQDWASIAELTDLLTILFAPVVGLVGAVTGFYFGEKYASLRGNLPNPSPHIPPTHNLSDNP